MSLKKTQSSGLNFVEEENDVNFANEEYIAPKKSNSSNVVNLDSKAAIKNAKKKQEAQKASMKSKNKNNKLPKTAQETIPYENCYRSGVIETVPGFFTKSYKLTDINFRVAAIEDQEKIFESYRKLLDSFDADKRLQIVINNKNVSEEEVLSSALCKMERDNLNNYRQEINQLLKDKMKEGRNNLVSEKYLVVGSQYKDIEEAKFAFNRIDEDINNKMREISGSQDTITSPQTITERLKCLHDIMNAGHENEMPEEIDFKSMMKAGLSTKDLIAPAGFRFDINQFRMGEKYAQALFIKNLPSSLTTDFMADLAALPFNFTATFTIEPIAQDVAMKTVKNQLINIRGNVIQAQKDAAKAGYSGELISSDLKFANEQAEDLMDDLRTSNQKLYFFSCSIMHYADSQEELKQNTLSIRSVANKHLVSVDTLLFKQEAGFRSALPLCRNDAKIERMMTTDGVSLFIPFTTKELIQKGGMYYGLNAVSHNLLLFNRLTAKNQNGLILGVPGSGKSFAAKREMINVFLTTQDDIYVIDPESEYAYMAKLLGGEVIHIESGSHIYINPFDMDIDYGSQENSTYSDPVAMKSDYICMLCETAMGGRYEISNVQRSIIDRVVIEMYKPYMKHMREINDRNITCDTAASPTMDSFYDMLMSQPEPEAQNIALALEIYCRGSFDAFAHRTNVDINNRFTVYDIKDIGNGMKEMGLQVCLNHIWNKIIDNQKKGKRTWFYIDEFHVLTKTRSSANFLQQIWKRARKWGGIPTAITQNVEDLLNSEESRAIINNCEFVLMLSQSPIDRAALAEMYHISESQLNYITNSPPGQGLIYYGQGIIPFIDKFPKDTELYKIMSSKPEERKLA